MTQNSGVMYFFFLPKIFLVVIVSQGANVLKNLCVCQDTNKERFRLFFNPLMLDVIEGHLYLNKPAFSCSFV